MKKVVSNRMVSVGLVMVALLVGLSIILAVLCLLASLLWLLLFAAPLPLEKGWLPEAVAMRIGGFLGLWLICGIAVLVTGWVIDPTPDESMW